MVRRVRRATDVVDNREIALGTNNRRCQPDTVGGDTKGFPTERRPEKKKIDKTTPWADVKKWVEESGITIGELAATEKEKQKAARLLYTYREIFATNILDIQETDLIEHEIPLIENAKPVIVP